MAEIADETKRSIVTVTGVTSELDLFNDVSESHSSTAGVIISKTEGTLLILTEKNTISDADSIKVTFEDGSIADGWLQASDEISDLAVVKVFSRELGETTAAYVEAAEFADSGETKIGDPIIALSAGYVSFGTVSYTHLDVYKRQDEATVANEIAKMEQEHIICGYHTLKMCIRDRF